jgi:hypothetical protein
MDRHTLESIHAIFLRDRSLFMEGGRGIFSFLFKSPPRKSRNLMMPPLHIRIFFLPPPPPFSFLLVKWGYPGVIVLIII